MQKTGQILCITADAHEVVREGITAIIDRQNDMHVIGEARNGREAVELCKQQHPNVCITCLRMPDIDGIDAIKAIRRGSPRAHILVLTSQCRDEDLYLAMRAGVKGILLKDATKAQISDAIRTVNRGRTVLSDEMRKTLAKDVPSTRMTRRERDVLSCIARGLSNQEIALDLHISRATVKTHAERVFTKLNVSDRTQAVVQALKRGLVRVD